MKSSLQSLWKAVLFWPDDFHRQQEASPSPEGCRNSRRAASRFLPARLPNHGWRTNLRNFQSRPLRAIEVRSSHTLALANFACGHDHGTHCSNSGSSGKQFGEGAWQLNTSHVNTDQRVPARDVSRGWASVGLVGGQQRRVHWFHARRAREGPHEPVVDAVRVVYVHAR